MTNTQILTQMEQIKMALNQRGNMSMRNQQMARKQGMKFQQKKRR